MTFEQFQAMVSVMTNEQFNKLETRVFALLKEDGVFTKSELKTLETEAEARKSFTREVVLN